MICVHYTYCGTILYMYVANTLSFSRVFFFFTTHFLPSKSWIYYLGSFFFFAVPPWFEPRTERLGLKKIFNFAKGGTTATTGSAALNTKHTIRYYQGHCSLYVHILDPLFEYFQDVNHAQVRTSGMTSASNFHMDRGEKFDNKYPVSTVPRIIYIKIYIKMFFSHFFHNYITGCSISECVF